MYLSPKSLNGMEINTDNINLIKICMNKMKKEIQNKRSQLSRIQQQILQRDKQLTKNVEVLPFGKKNVILQLQSTLVSSQNRLDLLRSEVEAYELSDKKWEIMELQEDVKAIFLEYRRLEKDLIQYSLEANKIEKQFKETEQKLSISSFSDINRVTNETKKEIKLLIERVSAYQLYIEKCMIETRLSEIFKDPNQNPMDNAEIDLALLNKQNIDIKDEIAKLKSHQSHELEETQSILNQKKKELISLLVQIKPLLPEYEPKVHIQKAKSFLDKAPKSSTRRPFKN